MVFNPFESIAKFVDSVSEQINITFKNISDFLDLTHTFFVTLGFWISVLIFFLLLILLLFGPLMLFKYWNFLKDNWKQILMALISKGIE